VRARTVEQLATVATVYRLAVEDGKSPVDAVAAKLGIGYGAAKMRIHRARRAGLNLGHASRGDVDTA
jgi:hypothetical protein